MIDVQSRVLIVDDFPAIRKMMKKALTELGFACIWEAVDGEAAWAAIKSQIPPFDLVISDWNMPNCTGIELLRKIRAHEKFRRTPFILVTTENEKGKVLEAVTAGATNFIVKPFTVPLLREKLERIPATPPAPAKP